ncbi:MAG: hypothetical protein M3R13_06685 [Armatimonadota bacterium]|nr:hypothetical protein [Armatimonadota bacterium]
MFRLFRRDRHARVIHAKAKMPVDMAQVRELAASLESPPDSTTYKVALLETETCRFLLSESLALDEDGLRLHKIIFQRAKVEPELATIVAAEMNDAPIGRLMRALIMESVKHGCYAVVFELRDDVSVACRGNNGEVLPHDPIPRNLWEPMLGWATRAAEIGWTDVRRWYRDPASLPGAIEVEVTETTFRLSWAPA